MTLHSENINELMTALAKAQGQMSHAIKDSVNPHYKSKFADLASVWQACREPLSANGLAISQTLDISGEKQVLVTMLGHTSGQWIKSMMALPCANRPQEMGSLLTYFRRYSLAAICGVYQDDDDGEAAQAAYKKENVITEMQAAELNALLLHVPEAHQWILERFNLKNVHELPTNHWEYVSSSIRKKMKKKEEVSEQT